MFMRFIFFLLYFSDDCGYVSIRKIYFRQKKYWNGRAGVSIRNAKYKACSYGSTKPISIATFHRMFGLNVSGMLPQRCGGSEAS